jgi:hypothetical protein
MLICENVVTRAAIFSCGQVTTMLTSTSTGTYGYYAHYSRLRNRLLLLSFPRKKYF